MTGDRGRAPRGSAFWGLVSFSAGPSARLRLRAAVKSITAPAWKSEQVGATLAAMGFNACCERSLKRLETDVIDLYYIHCFDPTDRGHRRSHERSRAPR